MYVSQLSTLQDSDSASSSSTPSSAAALTKKKVFSIPHMWKPGIMAAIAEQKLNPDTRNEIVRDLVTYNMYSNVDKPGVAFASKVARMLVEKYPFMADSSKSTPSVSLLYSCTL